MVNTTVPTVDMQGIAVPQSSVNAQLWQQLTRRLTFQQKGFTWAGLGNTDQVSLLQTGIIAGISIKVSGQIVATAGTGSIASTMRWPYDLVRACRVAANGQSNLINCHGSKLKYRDVLARGVFSDRGVQPLGGAASATPVGVGGAYPGTLVQQGTMALASEIWGVGQNVTAIPGAPTTYPFELDYYAPLAWDELTMTGAIFAQTSATDLTVAIDWAPITDLFVLSGNATVVLSAAVQLVGRVFSIPEVNGEIVVPDLSTFHSLIESRYTAVGNGDNEIRLAGQGVGRQLMRLFYQVWNGNPAAPIPLTAANFGQQGWRFGGNDTPENLPDGRHLRYFNERLLNADEGGQYGIGLFDFSKEFAFRDSVDEGQATELRLLTNIAPSVSLTTPAVEYVQETVFAGATGA